MEDSIRIKDAMQSEGIVCESNSRRSKDELEDVNVRVLSELLELRKDVEEKFRFDNHKERMIDTLHNQLQEHRENLVLKAYKPLVIDIITMMDNNNKAVENLKVSAINETDILKLLRVIENVSGDLEDMLTRQGVEAYTSASRDFDGRLHTPLVSVDTFDISNDKKIARSLKPGYMLEDKVIKKEIVEVYNYKNNMIDDLGED